MKIFVCGADRCEKLGILAVFTIKFNVFKEKRQLMGTGTTFLTGTGMSLDALTQGRRYVGALGARVPTVSQKTTNKTKTRSEDNTKDEDGRMKKRT